MTKKHFEWLAEWLGQYPNLLDNYDALDDLMHMCSVWNPKFDRKKFLLSAGFEAEEIKDIWDI